MGMTKRERAELLDELRDIALKFYRGNHQENRIGYKEAGMLDRLDVIIRRLKGEDEKTHPLQGVPPRLNTG